VPTPARCSSVSDVGEGETTCCSPERPSYSSLPCVTPCHGLAPLQAPMLHKVLVANRGEGLPCFNRTGCPERRRFPHEDRKSEHVLKADEATRSELQDILPATTSTQRRSHGLWSRQKRTQSTRVTQMGRWATPGGWPERFRARALQGRNTHEPVSKLSSEDAAVLATDPRNTVNRLLIPGPSKYFASSRISNPDLSVLSTSDFLHALDVAPSTRSSSNLVSIFSWWCSQSATLTNAAYAHTCAPSTVSPARCSSATS
jgi:hypothetical protein